MTIKEEKSSAYNKINNMEELIAVINKLQDVFNTLGLSNTVELPQIVMLGSQSAGKSSVLESIVGRSFLPRGTGIVTRCPLELQLIECKNDSKYRRVENGTNEIEEWGVFLHCKDKIFTDFDEIRMEIEAQTDRLAGNNKGIYDTPINLKIYSPNVVNLTLVDLPGITKVPVGDQPDDIEDQIKKLVMKYIENEKSIILSVSAANADLATSESLKFAKEVDPDGTRTLAVLTKIDIMDDGTNASDMLNGKIIPVKLGIVGVVNRSQQNIIDNMTIDEQLEKERKFFEKNYMKIAHRNGIPYLATKLRNLLMNHIYECLPKLREDISSKRSEYQKVFDACGGKVTDPTAVLVDVISKLTNDFNGTIDGLLLRIDTNAKNVIGGPILRKIFDETFTKNLELIEPRINQNEIIEIIKNSGGPRPSVFAPEALFEQLIKEQIKRLREPSKDCLNEINDEMDKIIKQRIKTQLELSRFPKLQMKVREILIRFLNERLPEARDRINYLVDIELTSINTHHPEFSIEEALKELQDDSDDEDGGKTMTIDLKLPKVPKIKISHKKKEKKHAEVIEKLIKNYFPIVKKTVQDLVPKIIMHSMIVHMKNNIQGELYKNLFDKKEELLSESHENAQRRDEAENMLKALKAADQTIKQVYEM